MKRPLKVLVCGAAGRMGRAVRAEIEADPAFAYAGGVEHEAGASAEGPGAFAGLLAAADAVVDFSAPAAACGYAAACAKARVPFVTGTTGFSKPQLAALRAAGRKTPVFFSPNMSPAVNLTFALAALAAARLKNFDIHIHEAHHTAKKDAPSGTALRLAEAVREGRDGGPAIHAQLNGPFGVVRGPDRALYVCDTMNHAIRRRAIEIGSGEIVEIPLCPQHVCPGIIDVEKILQIAKGIGRTDILHAGIGNGDAVALGQREHEFRLQTAFDMQMKFSLGQGADEAVEISHDAVPCRFQAHWPMM